MKARTEELVYLLLWGADILMQPTFRNLTDSFEEWCYRRGFGRQLVELKRRQILERKPAVTEPVYRLTEQGRLSALGGRDPQVQWERPWDGQWRLVIFDLPQRNNARRVQLRRFLRQHGFGYLQNSVWIAPDPLTDLIPQLKRFGEDVESLIMLEARPVAGKADSALVAGAWDFRKINRSYEKSAQVLEQLPQVRNLTPNRAGQLQHWARQERAAWLAAVSADPLLPSCLLPADYLGKEVWKRRARILQEAASQWS